MADTETTEVNEDTTDAPEEVVTEASGPKQLREALKRSQEEASGYRTQLMSSAYQEVGLNPNEGLGKAIAKEYDGEPTSAALAEYAKTEYKYESEVTPENEKSTQIAAGQTVLDKVDAVSIHTTPKTEMEELAKAQSDGDLTKQGQIKANQLGKMFARQQGVS